MSCVSPCAAFPEEPSSVRGFPAIKVKALCQLQDPRMVSGLGLLVLLQPVSPDSVCPSLSLKLAASCELTDPPVGIM